MKKDNNKHTSFSTQTWLVQKNVNVFKQLSHSHDLNSTELLWKDVKQAVYVNNSINICSL